MTNAQQTAKALFGNQDVTIIEEQEESAFIVIVTRNDGSGDYARFDWDNDLSGCDYVQFGVTDEEMDAMIEAKAHEGSLFEGFTVVCK